MSSLGEQLRGAFERINEAIRDPVIMTRCIDVCTSTGLSPEQLAHHWEAFRVNHPTVGGLTVATFERFRSDVVAKLPLSIRTPSKTGSSSASAAAAAAVVSPEEGATPVALSASLFGRYGKAAPAVPSTPVTPVEGARKRPLASSGSAGPARAESLFSASPSSGASQSPAAAASSSDNYAKRRGAGEVRVHFNSALADVVVAGASTAVKKTVSVELLPESTRPYKYLWDPLEARAGVFRETAARLGNLLLNKHEQAFEGAELGAFHLPRPEVVLCTGKVCSGGDADERLEARSVLLEGQAPENDNLYRVRLELQHCPSFSLFPGQIVAVKGVNPTGSALVVKQVVSDASLPVAETDERQVYEQSVVKVTVAAGPFCSSENLEYRPLGDLVDVALSNGTDVLVLVGPFVDEAHPDVSAGAIGRTYDDLFVDALTHHVLRRVDAHNATAARGKLVQKVVLIPSLADVHHHPVFPQFGFSADAFAAFRDLVVLAPNPCQVRINGVLFGFTSVDPLRHLGAATLLQRPQGAPAVSRLLEMAAHVIEQQSFLPLNPPPPDVSLDCSTGLTGVEFGEFTPQVLVLPSALKEFVDPLRGVLVVNPSFLVKGGSGGGTFAEIMLYPKGGIEEDGGGVQPMDLDDNNKAYHLKRIGVKIVRI